MGLENLHRLLADSALLCNQPLLYAGDGGCDTHNRIHSNILLEKEHIIVWCVRQQNRAIVAVVVGEV